MKRLLALLSILVVMTLALLGCGSGNNSRKWYGIVKFPQGGIVEGVVDDYWINSSGAAHICINGVTYIVGVNNFIMVRNDFLEEE